MPLVTRLANSASYFKGPTADESTVTFAQGDQFYNTTTDTLKVYNGSSLGQVGITISKVWVLN